MPPRIAKFRGGAGLTGFAGTTGSGSSGSAALASGAVSALIESEIRLVSESMLWILT